MSSDEELEEHDSLRGDILYPEAILVDKYILHWQCPGLEIGNQLVRQTMKQADDEFRALLDCNDGVYAAYSELITDEIDVEELKEDPTKGALLLMIQNALKNRLRFAVRQWSDINEIIALGYVRDKDDVKLAQETAEREFDITLRILEDWKTPTIFEAVKQAKEAQQKLLKEGKSLFYERTKDVVRKQDKDVRKQDYDVRKREYWRLVSPNVHDLEFSVDENQPMTYHRILVALDEDGNECIVDDAYKQEVQEYQGTLEEQPKAMESSSEGI